LGLLEEMAFDVDLSTAPGFDYRREAGPDFSRFHARLSWFGKHRRLLEIPTTGGFTGLLHKNGAALYRLADRPALKSLRPHGIMGRSRLLSRIRLSPEGHSLEDMKQISRAMIKSGARHLTLSFHSSSMQPGFTPYCSSEPDVERMLAKLEEFLKYFLQELHGETTSPLALYTKMQQIDRPHSQ
jgi:hypothetical protein